MILASNSIKAFRVAVVPSEFTSNIAEFGNPVFRLESLNSKELPDGYTRVSWIARNGGSINTGYYPNHNSEILIDRSGLMDYTNGLFGCGSLYTSKEGSEGYTVQGYINSDFAKLECNFGLMISDYTSLITFPIPHGAVAWDSSGENPFEGYESEIAETRYSIYMSKDELRVGAESRPNPVTLVSTDPWYMPFILFGIGVDTGSEVMTAPLPDIIFSFKVSESGVPVVNMLPCIEDATGQPGFYDTIRDIFITGEGSFFTGEVVGL